VIQDLLYVKSEDTVLLDSLAVKVVQIDSHIQVQAGLVVSTTTTTAI
jgi:hypothetical protein